MNFLFHFPSSFMVLLLVLSTEVEEASTVLAYQKSVMWGIHDIAVSLAFSR